MATGLEHPADQSTTTLVTGIIADLQNLVEQQFMLIRQEITRDVRQGMKAATMMAAGAAVMFLGGISFCMAAALWLHWMSLPAGADLSSLPLWSCHAIVAGIMLAVGGLLTISGRTSLKTIKPLESPAATALKENVEWTTNAPLK